MSRTNKKPKPILTAAVEPKLPNPVVATILQHEIKAPQPDNNNIETNKTKELQIFGTQFSYAIDTFQRTILFWDAIRKRADNFLEFVAEGKPPVLNFEYELLLDARTFEEPCNYALVKITAYGNGRLNDNLDKNKPPLIIVDPRAGQSPGIGGFKQDSEVGIALNQGYPVYFVIFYPRPVPHQTIKNVLGALRVFVEHVKKLHNGKPPVMHGNCQAGWMLVLLAADCEGLAGPSVLCGAPLSYWAGKQGKNVMQLEGGLLGGVWLNRFLSDLGAGEFDGAWLIYNFENLNPAGAIWTKYYNLYSKIDTEEERFLSFERWWGGFYLFSTEEIVATVSELFIGNKLEDGELQLHSGCHVNMRNIKNPILIFASEGDTITPPYEALAWVAAVYDTTDDLKSAGQRIIYMIDPKIGHLGIFVSAEIARHERTAILGNIELLDNLKPGLYEMQILDTIKDNANIEPMHNVIFQEREIEDIASHYSKEGFENVRTMSEQNDKIYSQWVSPFVRAISNPFSTNMLRLMHPMRTTRYMWSQCLNPSMIGIAFLASLIRENRITPSDDLSSVIGNQSNIFIDKIITTILDEAHNTIDDLSKEIFRKLYN